MEQDCPLADALKSFSGLQRALNLVDEKDLSRLMPNLKDRSQTRRTVDEVFVGATLSLMNYYIEYEKDYHVDHGVKSPDWSAILHDKIKLIVEVMHVQPSDSSKSRDTSILQLMKRIEKLEQGYFIRMCHTDDQVILSEEEASSSYREIKNWMSCPRQRGDNFTSGAIQITIDKHDPILAHPFVFFSRVFSVGSDSLGKRLPDKIKHYKRLCTLHGLPLVLAVFCDIRTGLGRAEVAEQLSDESLFSRYPHLHGILCLKTPSATGAEATSLLSPNASGESLRVLKDFPMAYRHWKQH